MTEVFPAYDLDRLTREARRRLRTLGLEPTSLSVYHLVASIRAEELRARCKGKLLGQEPVHVQGGMVEEGS